MSSDDQLDTESTGTEGQDNSLIRDLRRQIKDRDDKIKKLQSQEDILEQVRTSTAENLLMEAGYPGLLDDVLEKIEGLPNSDSVGAFLEARGLKATASESEASPEEEGGRQPSAAEVAGLGQQVASAAQRSPADQFSSDLEATKSQEDIEKVMAKHGLVG